MNIVLKTHCISRCDLWTVDMQLFCQQMQLRILQFTTIAHVCNTCNIIFKSTLAANTAIMCKMASQQNKSTEQQWAYAWSSQIQSFLTLVLHSVLQPGSSNSISRVSSEFGKMENNSKTQNFTIATSLCTWYSCLTFQMVFADYCIWFFSASLGLAWHPLVCPGTKLEFHIQKALISRHSNQEISFLTWFGSFWEQFQLQLVKFWLKYSKLTKMVRILTTRNFTCSGSRGLVGYSFNSRFW